MYTKETFKKEICEYIEKNGYAPDLVAKKAYQIYSDHIREIDSDLRDKLLDIAGMDMGLEFELQAQEFNDYLSKL